MAAIKSKMRDSFDRFARYRHIAAVLAKYGIEDVAGSVRSKFSSETTQEPAVDEDRRCDERAARPTRVRCALEELGPTFIKFGQLLSTRPDLVAPEYVAELEHLQDRVLPHPVEGIIEQIETELGGSVSDLFQDFDKDPIAAGSIAQIHRAVLMDGSEVAVKVRRPGIVRIVKTECEILQDLTALLRTTLFQHSNVDLKKMVENLADAVMKETDLANERRNQRRFMRLFEEDPTVHIPRIYEDQCSQGVLTMEYIRGVKPTDKAGTVRLGLDCSEVARRGADFVLRQMFEYGFFHTDPHPGNIILLEDNIIAPIDFGQCARLSARDRQFFNEIVLAIVDRDAERVVRSVEREEMLTSETDVHRLTTDIEQLLDMYHDFSLKDIPFGAVATQTFELFRTNAVHPPSQFTLMLKSMMTIESLATTLDPEFRLIEALKPYARRSTFEDFEPKKMLRHLRTVLRDEANFIRNLPGDVSAVLTKFKRGKFQLRIHHEHLENLTKTIDKSSNRISFALIIAALLVASSMLVPQEGTVLGLFSLQTMGVVGYVIAAAIGIWLVVSILRSRHL